MTVQAQEVQRLDRRPVDVAAGIWLVVSLLGTLVGVLQRWPAQFGGAGRPDEIGSELFTKGTVLSPPLFMLVLMALGLGLAHLHQRGGWLTGLVLLGLVGLVGVVGSFGEVVAPATPDVPRVVQVLGLVGVALSAFVVVVAARSLVRRAHAG